MEPTSRGTRKKTHGGARNNHYSSSLLGASSAASRASSALDMSLASSFSAPSLLPRADHFQSPMTMTMMIQLTNESVYCLFGLPFKRLQFLLQIALQVPICPFGCDIQQVLCKGNGRGSKVLLLVLRSQFGPTLIQPMKNRERRVFYFSQRTKMLTSSAA